MAPRLAPTSPDPLEGSPDGKIEPGEGESAESASVVYADFAAGTTLPSRPMDTMPESNTDAQPKGRDTLPYGADPEAGEPELRRIGDFLIRRLLGEGGMGKVYEAEERLSRRKVALKVLRNELSRSEQGRRQFVTEMGILASLDDPHVVRCLHCTEVDGQLVMALEYLEGRTLREAMNERGALPWDEVVALTWQIASALRAAHSREPAIIHRDLKPENVMLVAEGRVKVMDFGIAKIVQAVSGATTHSVGTLQYMSPEQIDARPLDARSDLYALGLVMWELLAGRPPFESESPRLLLDKLCTEPAPPLPDEARRGLPRGVEQLIVRLLEKDPEARPRDAAEVLEVLEPFRPAELTSGGSAATSSGPRTAAANPTARPGLTGTPLPSTSPSPSPSVAKVQTDARELRPQAKRFDTVAVVERAARAREISNRTALTIIVALSLTAGLLTWLARLLA
jgi:serine/threonine protein kinase